MGLLTMVSNATYKLSTYKTASLNTRSKEFVLNCIVTIHQQLEIQKNILK